MQVLPCKCIDFHAERRPRTPYGPTTIELALTSRKPFSKQFSWSLEQHVSSKPYFRNRERTFHVLPLPRTTTSRRLERRRPLVGSTPSRRPRWDAPPQVLARVARPRPRARRRLAPRDTMDHSRRTRLVPAAPAIVVSQQRPTAAPRRAREWPNASPAFTSNDRPFPRLFLYGVARHSCPPGPRRSAASACSSVWLQLRPREGAGNFRLHGASMRPMPRALVEF